MTNLPGRPTFYGFDGNEESDHYTFMKFFINDMHRYEGLTAMNSHYPTLDIYRSMLSEYMLIKKEKGSLKLSEEEVLRILNAQ